MLSPGVACASAQMLYFLLTNARFLQNLISMLVSVCIYHRSRGIKLHAANSAGALLGYGTDLDFVRPGIAMYGLPPG